jgi:phosphate starvation-inducible protein PhoH and related proteins
MLLTHSKKFNMTRKRRKKEQGSSVPVISNTNPSLPANRTLQAKTDNQQRLMDSINSNTITFVEGPAGSGKSHICVGMAIDYLRRGVVNKIIITRPVVQADEDLGYLPGSFDDKLHPYMLPIYDELAYYATKAEVEKWRQELTIEVAPLAYMRGRNFHQSFIIVDEAQNCTYKQLQMVLTRTGRESIMVVNGDSEQTDLTRNKSGALNYYMEALDKLPYVGIVRLNNDDIVRNPLISKVLDRLLIYQKLKPFEDRVVR